jgi:cell division septum initiation protein DivIVA
MTDHRLKGRVKGLFAGQPLDSEPFDEQPPAVPAGPALGQVPHVPQDSEAERQALQVLVLARRTADEHVSTAQHEAHKIRAEARAWADEVAREVQANAEAVRRDADDALADARAKAEQVARDAQAGVETARRESDKILAAARAKADQISKEAQAKADELEQEAQERYDEIVGTLEEKSGVLQQQIATLKKFDRDYRTRLAKFMQGQLRALGIEDEPVEEPEDLLELDEPAGTATAAQTTAHLLGLADEDSGSHRVVTPRPAGKARQS